MYKKIFAVLIVLIIINIYTSADKGNIGRHKTNEFDYAHFSKITTSNYCMFPSLLLATPYTVVLQPGECLWIPKHWWHWIRSYKSIAINFWSPDTFAEIKYALPFKCTSKMDNTLFLDTLKKYNKPLHVWNSDSDTITEVSNFANVTGDNTYIITVHDCTLPDTKINTQLHTALQSTIQVPQMFNDKTAHSHMWISTGYHDTGLHRDDNHGMLCNLEGTKTITLYAPEDTTYLHPMCLLPTWSKCVPQRFEYNIYKSGPELNVLTNLPSSRLLYESILCHNNKSVMSCLSSIMCKIKTNTLVWGCKLYAGVMRWEIYAYHYNDTALQLRELAHTCAQSATLAAYVQSEKNIIIHSYDLLNNTHPLQHNIHFYHRSSDIKLPFFGYGTSVANDIACNESVFVTDTQDNFILQFAHYVKKLGFVNVQNCKALLSVYACTHICIHKKNDSDIFIQYLGISITDFITFLQLCNYPQQLITHVCNNKDKYAGICHEITIVYNVHTHAIVRSAFYGVL